MLQPTGSVSAGSGAAPLSTASSAPRSQLGVLRPGRCSRRRGRRGSEAFRRSRPRTRPEWSWLRRRARPPGSRRTGRAPASRLLAHPLLHRLVGVARIALRVVRTDQPGARPRLVLARRVQIRSCHASAYGQWLQVKTIAVGRSPSAGKECAVAFGVLELEFRALSPTEIPPCHPAFVAASSASRTSAGSGVGDTRPSRNR